MKPKVLVLGNHSSGKTDYVYKSLLALEDAGKIEVVYENNVTTIVTNMWIDEVWAAADCSLKALPQPNPQKAFLLAMKDKQNKLDSKKSRR